MGTFGIVPRLTNEEKLQLNKIKLIKFNEKEKKKKKKTCKICETFVFFFCFNILLSVGFIRLIPYITMTFQTKYLLILSSAGSLCKQFGSIRSDKIKCLRGLV